MLRQLESLAVSSRDLVESCLEAIENVSGEGSHTFLRVYAEEARRTADAIDSRRQAGDHRGALLGVPISIKDLFDVAGETTLAGSIALAETPVARADASVVRRLKDAGAVLIGRTNMTEFAYSGLGLNPHYGTPRNFFDRANGRIPGGSSSGCAVSVTDGMAAASVGSDTGGSVRIPAALCGLTGFKPTARRVPMDGMLPLAPSLDSIGPIARTVDCCARVDAVLTGEEFEPLTVRDGSSLRLAVLDGYVLEDLEAEVGTAFERAIAVLTSAGATIVTLKLSVLDQVPAGNQFASAEAFAWHRELLTRAGLRYDRHVSERIWQGAAILAADYLTMLRVRHEIIQEVKAACSSFDAILLPTTAWTAPTIASLEASDEAYFAANGAMLRNPSLINYLDGCAATIPCHSPESAPVGLMVAGLGGWDRSIFEVSATIERILGARM